MIHFISEYVKFRTVMDSSFIFDDFPKVLIIIRVLYNMSDLYDITVLK